MQHEMSVAAFDRLLLAQADSFFQIVWKDICFQKVKSFSIEFS